MQEKMQQVCYFLSVTTPFGKRIVELITSYTVGEGFKVTANDRKRAGGSSTASPRTRSTISKTIADYSGELRKVRRGLHSCRGERSRWLRSARPQRSVEIRAIEFGQMQTSSGQADVMFPVAVQLKQQIGEPRIASFEIIRTDDDPCPGDVRLSQRRVLLLCGKQVEVAEPWHLRSVLPG
jgi:hypothetical protein